MNILKKPLKLILSVVAILLLIIILLLPFGFRLDLSPWRQTIIQAANDSLPYQLSLDGEMEATLGFHPSVRLSNISLTQESSPDEPVVTIGYISAQVGLLPLLRNTIDIDHILMDSVDIHLKKDDQGQSNWQVASATLPEEVSLTGEQAEYSPSSLPGYQLKIENKIALNNLNIVYIDETESLQFGAGMESLAMAIDASNNLTLNAYGTLQFKEQFKEQRKEQQEDLQEKWQFDSLIALDSLLKTQQGQVSLKASLADAGVQLDGNINLAEGENTELALKASMPTAGIIEKIAGQDMSLLAPVAVKSRIVANPASTHLNDLDIAFSDSQLTGIVHVQKADLPIVEGSLNMDGLDLAPWLALAEKVQSQETEKPPSDQNSNLQNDETASLTEVIQNWLNSAEIDFDFSLTQLTGLPVEIDNTQLAITMNNGRLHAPASLSVADMPLSGEITMAVNDNDHIVINSSMTSQAADIGPLFSALLEEDAKGHVESLSLDINASGESVSEMLRHALLDFELSNGHLTVDQKQQWKLRSVTARLGLNRDTNIQVDADLLDIPVKLGIQADPLIGLQTGTPWQLQLNADSPAFTGKAEGFVSEKGLKEDSRFIVEMNAAELGALSKWFGIKDDSDQPMHLSGELVQQKNILSVSLPELRIGETTGEIGFDWDTSAASGIANLKTHFSKLNLDELLSFLPEELPEELPKELPEPEDKSDTQQPAVTSPSTPTAGPRPGPAPGSAPGPMAGPGAPSGSAESEGVNLNAPLLGKNVQIPDANIDFRIDELIVSGQIFSNLTFAGEIRDSQLTPSPLSAEFADSRFYGDLALDLSDQTLAMDFDLGVDQPDFGRILSELNVVSDMDLFLDKARFSLNLKGKTIGELIQQVRMNASLEGGTLRLIDANTGAASEILLSSGSISAQPNMRLTLKMDGELKELPVELEVSFNPLSRLLTSRNNVTMQLSVRMPDIHLLSYSVVNLPVDQRNMRLGIILKTPNLSALNPLLDVDMPPLGPVEMHGRFGVNPDGYEIRQSTVNIGDTRLVGDLKLLTLGDKPDLAIHLAAPTIQLNDFKLGDWKAWEEKNDTDKPAPEDVVATPDESDKTASLISAETMNALNASFKVDVDEVLSGEDRLGEGKLRLKLGDGNLNLNPLFVALPGGEIYATGHLKPVDAGFNVVLQSNIDRFDYGVMARRIDPETKMQGEVSVNINIDTTAATPDDLFSHARGNFGFAVWPRDFEAGIIDLWAVGLASAVLPRLGPEDPSQLNCAVGTFNLEDGQMSDIALMLDTSQMQVAGHSSVNFTDQKIELELTPRAKTAQIFGLSLPIRVTGSFTDFGIGVPPTEAIMTTIRFVTSPVVAPISWLFQQPLGADGSVLCQQIYNQSRSFLPLRP